MFYYNKNTIDYLLKYTTNYNDIIKNEEFRVEDIIGDIIILKTFDGRTIRAIKNPKYMPKGPNTVTISWVRDDRFGIIFQGREYVIRKGVNK